MNIKYLLSAALTAAIGLTFASCDDIKESDRFVELPEVALTKRVALLEDFTGQYCPNCPDAHRIIDQFMDQYPDNVIAVAIHGGDMAEHVDDGGLATDDGNAYVGHWGVTTFPAGMVNRSSGVLDRTEWASVLRGVLENSTWVDIDLTATYDASTGEVAIATDITSERTATGKLQLWVTEDHIYSFQSNTSGMDFMYEHNHVYRASVNGLWGQSVSLTADDTSHFDHTIAVDDEWEPTNLAIVAFVYDNSGVVQAAKAHVACD